MARWTSWAALWERLFSKGERQRDEESSEAEHPAEPGEQSDDQGSDGSIINASDLADDNYPLW
jgi:hypothetical protein